MKTARTDLPLWASGLGLLLGAWLAACAASPKASTAMPDARTDASGGNPDVRALDQQIADDLARLGLAAPTDAEVTSAMVSHSVPALPMATSVATTCSTPPPTGGACEDVCTLADSICENAGRICRIADELGDDAWATQRCAAGELSCDRARGRCCGCE